jgi:hypothetical protein
MDKKLFPLWVICGCPRSGTSMAMIQHRLAFGEDMILGSEWPREAAMEARKKRRENESELEHKNRLYMLDRLIGPQAEAELEHTKNMNPQGFWECGYTVRGIQYHPGISEVLKEQKIVKIVSQGLFLSDPQYIGKVLYMVRDPRQVAKSQENLRRMPFIPIESEKEMKVHTPKMFIEVTYKAAKWFLDNPDVPVKLVNFDDMIASPDETLGEIQNFWGSGDFSKHTIEPRLKRSDPEDIDNYLWPAADLIYEFLKQGRWQDIVDFYDAKAKWIHREDVVTPCFRTRQDMAFNECLNCRECAGTRENFIKSAEARKVEWQKEPCMFEALTDPDREDHITIESSIENNFWSKNEYFKRHQLKRSEGGDGAGADHTPVLEVSKA